MPYGHEDPPFERNSTFFNGAPIDTSNLANIGGEQYEGKEYHFEDTVYKTGNVVTVRVVRNMSATAVLPSQTLLPATTDANAPYPVVTRVNGLAAATAVWALIADELIPTAGCPQYDLCYTVVRGPAKVISPTAGTTVSVGSQVVAAATGAAAVQDLSGATTALGNNVQNRLGRAMVALTSGQTNTAFPIAVGW